MGNWKEFERWTGREIFYGSKRNWGSGATNRGDDGTPRTGDVINPHWEVECKLYKTLAPPRWVYDIAKETDTFTRLPLVTVARIDEEDQTLVLMRYRDFNQMKDFIENQGMPLWEQSPHHTDFSGAIFDKSRYNTDIRVVEEAMTATWWDKLSVEAEESGKIPVLVMRETGVLDEVAVGVHYHTFMVMVHRYLLLGGEWVWGTRLNASQVRRLLNSLGECVVEVNSVGEVAQALVYDTSDNVKKLRKLTPKVQRVASDDSVFIDITPYVLDYAGYYLPDRGFVTEERYRRIIGG